MFKKTVITIFFIISTSTAYCFLDIYFFDPTGTWVSDSKTITWQPCYRITFKDNGLWEIKSNTVISKIFGSPGERWCSASPSSYSKSGNKIFLYWRPVNFDYDLQFQSQSVQIERAKEIRQWVKDNADILEIESTKNGIILRGYGNQTFRRK